VTHTLPPTDTASNQPTSSSGNGWRTVLIGLAALLTTMLLLTPTRVPARRMIRRR
jgi:hypothetical protein